MNGNIGSPMEYPNTSASLEIINIFLIGMDSSFRNTLRFLMIILEGCISLNGDRVDAMDAEDSMILMIVFSAMSQV